MLTFLLVSSESFTLCECFSPKLSLNKTTALIFLWPTAGTQIHTAARRSAAVFPCHTSSTLVCCVPKRMVPYQSSDETEQEIGELLYSSQP